MISTKRGPEGLRLVSRVVCQGINQGKAHDEHVTTFFDGHVFIFAVSVSGQVGEVGSKIMHGVVIGVLTAEHVFNQRFEKVCKPAS